jgi:alkylhydroperoxidase family enzyme
MGLAAYARRVAEPLRRLRLDELTPELQALLGARVERLGYLGEFFAIAGQQPDALACFYRFTETVKDALPWRLTEVVALTVAALTGNAYERVQHERLALSLGMDHATVAALAHCTPGFAELSEAERAAALLAREMVRRLGHGAGDALAELSERTSEPVAVACALLIGRYLAHAAISNAFGLQPPVQSPLTLEVAGA